MQDGVRKVCQHLRVRLCLRGELLGGGGLGELLALGAVCGTAVGLGVWRVGVQGEGVLFQQGGALGAHDLQPLGVAALAGGKNKGCRALLRVLHQQGGFVVHHKIVILTVGYHGINTGRHPEQPLPDIQNVLTLIEQRAAALPCPAGTPAAGAVVHPCAEVAAVFQLHPLDLAQRPIIQ